MKFVTLTGISRVATNLPALESRPRRGRVLALGERRLELAFDVAARWRGIRAGARGRLVARGSDDQVGSDVAVAFGRRSVDCRVAGHRDREGRKRSAKSGQIGRRTRARWQVRRSTEAGQIVVRVQNLPRSPFDAGARGVVG